MIKRSLDRFSSLGGSAASRGQAEKLQERVKGITLAATSLTTELAAAITSDQLFLEFQPTLDWRLGRITGAEALVRWNHPDHGTIPPNRFIPPAADGGLNRDLTNWVLTKAAAQAACWHAEELSIKIAVNISGSDLKDRGLPDRFQQHCRNASIDPSVLMLELTEISLIGEAPEKIDVLTRLRQKGFNLSLDDFGTGSLSSVELEQIPFSEAKIDLTFVTRMMSDPGCGRVVEILIDTARKLRLTSVAEGVENDEVLQRLLELGCDKVQGYYLSRPIAADLMPAFVREFEGHIRAADPDTDQDDRGASDYQDLAAHPEAFAKVASPVSP